MKKIGIYGGSFDPLHNGHLNLAFEIMEKGGLDEVWFIPAQINPHKTHCPPTFWMHRYHMLEQALESIPQFKVKNIEGTLPPPSYTIHTIKALLAEYTSQSIQFYLILGEDSIPGFFHWHQPKEIIQTLPLLIGSRTGRVSWKEKDQDPLISEAIQKGTLKTRLMDISATELRDRLAQGLYCGHLIPPKVLTYIHQNRLYQSKY
jgi:nicotinate-nucleotide adenylyltransferase